MSAGEWIALAGLPVTIAGAAIGAIAMQVRAHQRMAQRIATLETQVENLKEMREDWRKFILDLRNAD